MDWAQKFIVNVITSDWQPGTSGVPSGREATDTIRHWTSFHIPFLFFYIPIEQEAL